MNAIVADVKGGKAVVLRSDGVFAEISNRNYSVGQQINSYTPAYLKYCAAAACFLMLLITGFTGFRMYYTPVSYIYMDINPSLRLDVNRFERVISVDPLNEDAQRLVLSHDMKAADAEECIEEIISVCRGSGYLNGENKNIEIDVMTNQGELLERVGAAAGRQKDCAVTVRGVDGQKNKEAMELQISVGRLNAVKLYTEAFGGSVSDNARKLKNTPIGSIYDEIRSSTAAKEESAPPEPERADEKAPPAENSESKTEQANKQETKPQTGNPKKDKATDTAKKSSKGNSEENVSRENGTEKKDKPAAEEKKPAKTPQSTNKPDNVKDNTPKKEPAKKTPAAASVKKDKDRGDDDNDDDDDDDDDDDADKKDRDKDKKGGNKNGRDDDDDGDDDDDRD